MDTLIRLFFICAVILFGTMLLSSKTPQHPHKQPPIKVERVDVEKVFSTKLEDYRK